MIIKIIKKIIQQEWLEVRDSRLNVLHRGMLRGKANSTSLNKFFNFNVIRHQPLITKPCYALLLRCLVVVEASSWQVQRCLTQHHQRRCSERARISCGL